VDDRSHLLVGASCHNRSELENANNLGADFAMLSPVLATASHPETVPLGWDNFQEMIDAVNIPIYALGGMGRDYLETAILGGAQGIAAIRALWGE
jgi:8-oxo-dGTP diphosphatase